MKELMENGPVQGKRCPIHCPCPPTLPSSRPPQRPASSPHPQPQLALPRTRVTLSPKGQASFGSWLFLCFLFWEQPFPARHPGWAQLLQSSLCCWLHHGRVCAGLALCPSSHGWQNGEGPSGRGSENK